jgi:hypothetical protein
MDSFLMNTQKSKYVGIHTYKFKSNVIFTKSTYMKYISSQVSPVFLSKEVNTKFYKCCHITNNTDSI